ncbi:bifunctional (p)ppGpp synthetase/guanosine-3',5'-bis(diphosphate) 3'-pyrophosphohydrolase [Candidatus Saccharibacteria bacterium]|nr:bifunctional (p)ppGpp synthetase/guanosine-3',5'-bis(diphosphate) 3'-pyrophosphohydrolase [Candidatus Saccharibacteria bacterium]
MIKYTTRLDSAIATAASAHQNNSNEKKRVRKGTTIPYISHPYAVMLIASAVTDDEDVLIACLMHDVLEDVAKDTYSENQLREEFGERVVEIVHGVTKDDSIKDWRERSEAYLRHLELVASDESVIVSAADKMHNVMSILSDYATEGEQLWPRFNAGKKDQQWWYRSVMTVIKKRLPELSFLAEFERKVVELESL